MEITLKLSDASKLKNELIGLAKHALPGNVKMAVYRNIEILESNTSSFEKTVADLMEQYGEPFRGDFAILRFNGKDFDQKNEKYDSYLKDYEEIDTEITISVEQLSGGIFGSDVKFEGEMRQIYKHLVQ